MNTTNTETAAAPSAFMAMYDSIASSRLPVGLVPENIRSLSQKERTAKIRGLLKSCGIKMGAVGKGVSVTSATGSMCYWTNVHFERPDHAPGTDFRNHIVSDCSICRAERAMAKLLTNHILAAFPDLDDRSDLMTDYFDSVFSVSAV